MRIDTTFLRSKVAHRIFLLFIICAIVPMTSLAIISFTQVASQLEKQRFTQIHQDVIAKWMSIYDRLLSVETEMKVLSFHILRDYETKKGTPPRQLHSRQMYNQFLQRFRSLSIIKGDRVMPLVGHIEKIPPLRAGQRQHMSSGKPLIFTQNYPDQTPSIFMGMQIDSEHSGQGLLIAEIKPSYLWGIDREIFSETTQLCILDRSKHVLFSSPPSYFTPSFIKALSSMHPSSSNFE